MMKRVTISIDESRHDMLREWQGKLVSELRAGFSFSDVINMMLYIAEECVERCEDADILKDAFMKFAKEKIKDVLILKDLENTMDEVIAEFLKNQNR